MQPAKSHKVLVVEDEGLIALDISSRLEALGHEVVATVATAEEAIERAAEADIVLMDIHLEGQTDGVEAAAAIREQHHKPVLFLTAHADRATLDRAKIAAPFGYVVKPLAPAALQTSIETALYKHRLDRQLEEREVWLRTILDSVADGVAVTDIHGRIIMLNRAAESITGWAQPKAQGEPVSNVVRLLTRDPLGDTRGPLGDTRDPLGETREPGGSAEDPVELAILRDSVVELDSSLRLVGQDGREMPVEGAAAPVKMDGAAIGAVLSFRDVSARRWEERQIRQSQKLDALGRLSFGVSNEYLNLLGIIRNQADQLLHRFGEYAPARRAIEEIQLAASAAEQISRRLASFGTRQASRPEVISLNGLLRRTTKLIDSITGADVEVSLRLEPATGRVKADSSQIEQAIVSLVLHACASMPNGGRMLLETANVEIPVHGRMHPYAMLAITYTGEESDPERLFEPSSTGADGLALLLVHSMVTEHAGRLSAQRTASGGSRFEMLLPRWSEPPLLPRTETGRAPSILLVDGRDGVRLQLHNFFEANGYNLLEAADSSEALAVGEVHEGPLDAVIAEATEADSIAPDIRRRHPHAEFLKIVESAETTAHEIRRPFTQQALLERVRALIAARPKRDSAIAR